MPFTPVILWTDALLWLLVAATGAYLWICAQRPHLAAPWLRVARSRAAMISLALLAGYGAIGLADSLHFRVALPVTAAGEAPAYSPQVLSVLDLALAHLRRSEETTYSAPLAMRRSSSSSAATCPPISSTRPKCWSRSALIFSKPGIPRSSLRASTPTSVRRRLAAARSRLGARSTSARASA